MSNRSVENIKVILHNFNSLPAVEEYLSNLETFLSNCSVENFLAFVDFLTNFFTIEEFRKNTQQSLELYEYFVRICGVLEIDYSVIDFNELSLNILLEYTPEVFDLLLSDSTQKKAIQLQLQLAINSIKEKILKNLQEKLTLLHNQSDKHNNEIIRLEAIIELLQNGEKLNLSSFEELCKTYLVK